MYGSFDMGLFLYPIMTKSKLFRLDYFSFVSKVRGMKNEVKVIGILGDGQLGRMSAMAAQKLGIKTIIYGQDKNSPAAQVADKFIEGSFEDHAQLSTFADQIDVCGYEFENIPVDTIRVISKTTPTCPDSKLLEISQHRAVEKKFLNDAGIKTAKWTHIPKVSDVPDLILNTDRFDCIVKTCRFGYDGKGQIFIGKNEDLATKAASLNTDDLIMEQCIDFKCEISVIVARDQFGTVVTYDPPINHHKNHILDTSTVPAPLDPTILDTAIAMGKTLAERIDLIGVLALELFITKDGDVLANEIAPRTHNSGHWTMDACEISQFENHVRAVCGLPVLPPNRHSNVTMVNLIGDDINDLSKYESNPNAHIHLYGKAEARQGRKMGHVNILSPKS